MTIKPVRVGLGWFAGVPAEVRREKMAKYIADRTSLREVCNGIRLDIDTWLSGNKGTDVPRHVVVEIHDRLLAAIRQESTMIEIKAGPELDRAVAEAIGWTCVHKSAGGFLWFIDPSSGNGPRVFTPSTNLNDTFAAAEKVCLFDEFDVKRRKTGWGFSAFCRGDDGWSRFDECEHSTAALAICAAILKMRE